MSALTELADYTAQNSREGEPPDRVMAAPEWVERLRLEGNGDHVEEACEPEGWHWIRLVTG